MMDVFEIFDYVLSDDDEEVINLIEGARNPRNFRSRPSHMDEWNEKEFMNRFRLSKQSVIMLLQQIENVLLHPTERNHALTPLIQLLITLRLYACGSMLIVAGDFGGVHKSTVSHIVKNVSRAIASLALTYIRMPENANEIAKEKEVFLEIARFPNVIGAIDCTHIRIKSPGGETAEHFRNRKGFFSLNVQTVSNARGKIMNIVARWPGASHDSTIFNNSRLKAQFEEQRYGNAVLVGDSGYALSNFLLTPLENPLSPEEHLYNESQIRTRNVVERSYGIWKRRFPILRLEMRLKLETIKTIIVATAVVHNIALEMMDDEPDEYLEYDNEENERADAIPAVLDNGLAFRENLITQYFAHLL